MRNIFEEKLDTNNDLLEQVLDFLEKYQDQYGNIFEAGAKDYSFGKILSSHNRNVNIHTRLLYQLAHSENSSIVHAKLHDAFRKISAIPEKDRTDELKAFVKEYSQEWPEIDKKLDEIGEVFVDAFNNANYEVSTYFDGHPDEDLPGARLKALYGKMNAEKLSEYALKYGISLENSLNAIKNTVSTIYLNHQDEVERVVKSDDSLVRASYGNEFTPKRLSIDYKKFNSSDIDEVNACFDDVCKEARQKLQRKDASGNIDYSIPDKLKSAIDSKNNKYEKRKVVIGINTLVGNRASYDEIIKYLDKQLSSHQGTVNRPVDVAMDDLENIDDEQPVYSDDEMVANLEKGVVGIDSNEEQEG